LVGSNPEAFLAEAGRLWNDPDHYRAMAQPRFPYGDGKSSERIAEILGSAFLTANPSACPSFDNETASVP